MSMHEKKSVRFSELGVTNAFFSSRQAPYALFIAGSGHNYFGCEAKIASWPRNCLMPVASRQAPFAFDYLLGLFHLFRIIDEIGDDFRRLLTSCRLARHEFAVRTVCDAKFVQH